ncbi:MAG TPA: DUF1499 domain-containing protein [Gemmatimonadales bacterium]|nr:DUF1499 domain-containing protein [Gemmatimonadales bacterium]
MPLRNLALVVVALAVACLSAAGPGTRFGVWDYRFGFTLLRWGAVLGLVGAVLTLVALLRSEPPRRTAGFVLLILVGLGVAALPIQLRRSARTVPPIHDITTDTDDPPPFVAIAPLRADAPNPPEYAGADVAAQQRAAYPDIQPLRLAVPPATAFERVRQAARAMGWTIVAEVPAEGRLEAYAMTRFFGFVDDVVIRVRPDNDGSRVDIRSKSRVGRSDVGTNAKRIRAFVAELTGS